MRRATITLAILAFAALLTACNLWPILLDQQPTGNVQGRVMPSATQTSDLTPTREDATSRALITPASGDSRAAGQGVTEPTQSALPLPPPAASWTAQALGPTLTPPGTPDFYTPVGGCTPPPGAECGVGVP